MPTIHDLVFDDDNESKLWKRGIAPEDVFDLVAAPHLVVRNKRRRRGLYKLIGRGTDGRMLTIVIEGTFSKTVWRPVTGWPSTAGEITQFEALETNMTQREELLERMDEWDDEGTKSSGQSASAVLSVRFSRDELGAVRAAAARNEQTVSEFVRTAALEHAQSRLAIHVSLVHSSGAAYAGTMYFPTPASRTQAASPLISSAAA